MHAYHHHTVKLDRFSRGVGAGGKVRLSAMAMALAMVFPTSASTLIWTNTSGTKLFSDAGNWVGNSAAQANDSLIFGAIAGSDFSLTNNLAVPFNNISFTGGNYSLSGPLTLTATNTFDKYGQTISLAHVSASAGTQTIKDAIILQPLTLNRILSQEVMSQYAFSADGGATLDIQGALSVAPPTLLADLPIKANTNSNSTIALSTGSGSTLKVAALTADKLILNNNGNTVVRGLLSVGTLSLNGAGQVFLQDQGALALNAANRNVTLTSDATLNIDNSIVAQSGRLGNASITLDPRASLTLTGNAGAAVLEQGGQLLVNGKLKNAYLPLPTQAGKGVPNTFTDYYGGPDVNSAAAKIRVDGRGQLTVLSFTDLAFGKDSYPISSQYSNFGTYTFLSGGTVDFQSSGTLGLNERIVFGVAPGATYGLITGATVNGNEFASYDSTLSGGYARGVVAATTLTTLRGATAPDNVYLNGAGEELLQATTINSLALNNSSLAGAGLTLASGKLLFNGSNTINSTIDFGVRQGELNLQSGKVDLLGGLSGTNGALVRGVGVLTLYTPSSLTGVFDLKSPTLTLAADNVLTGADLVLNGNTLIIGGSKQSFASMSVGKISGNGAITASTGSLATYGNVDASLSAANGTITMSNSASGFDKASATAAIAARDVLFNRMNVSGPVSVSHALTANNSSLTGTLSGAGTLNIGGISRLGAVSELSGATAINGDFTVWGNGALLRTAAVDVKGTLNLLYEGAADRLNDAATLKLNSGAFLLSESVSGPSATVEKIGALTIAGGNNYLGLNGNVSLLADNLTVQNGAKLFVDLGSSGSVKFLTSPVAIDGTALNGVLVNRSTASGILPVWATYSAAAGLQTEHAVGTLASAGSGIVRVTSAPLNGIGPDAVSIGGALFDTSDTITGSGTLTSTSGLAFLKDNTFAVSALVLGDGSILSNAGSNTISSAITGGTVQKLGSGTIILTGNSQLTNMLVGDGRLVVDGNLKADVTNNSLTTDALTIRGNGRIDGYIAGTVTLQNAQYNNTSQYRLDSVRVLQGSSLVNNSYIGQVEALGTAKVTNFTGGGIDTLRTEAGSIVNAGAIGSAFTTSGNIFLYTGATMQSGSTNWGTLTNHGHINSFDNYGGQVINHGTIVGLSNGGMVTNHGTLGEAASIYNTGTLTNKGRISAMYVDNRGSLTNNGSFKLEVGGEYSGSNGTYVQTDGLTTIDGTFNGDILLQGGVLNGWGAVTGTVTAMAGASVKPGHSPGTMSFGNLVLESGATLTLDVSTLGGVSDRIIIDGIFLAQAGSHISFNLTDSSGATADMFQTLKVSDYFSLANTANGDQFNNIQFTANGTDNVKFYLTVDAQGDVASVTSVPEPDTYAMMLGGLGILGWLARRKRRQAAN